MHRRDILKALLFSSSTVNALITNAQPVSEIAEELKDNAHLFKSKWSKSPEAVCDPEVLLAEPAENWCIKNGELLCLVQMPHTKVVLKTHELSADGKSFNAEMIFRFMGEPAALSSHEDSAGFSFGAENKMENPGKEIRTGITRSGNLFIGQILSSKNISENILKEEVRLVLSVIPQSSGECFAKLRALDSSANTIVTLSSTEYHASLWHGNIAIVSHYKVNKVNADKPVVAISKFEIGGEKLSYRF